jgi:cyclopropane-fatty-acyl-phospholipid synthase
MAKEAQPSRRWERNADRSPVSSVLTDRTTSPSATLANMRALHVAQRIVTELFGAPRDRYFGVRYWNAAEEPAARTLAVPFTLVLRWSGALRRMLLPPTEMRLAEAFLHDDFDVEGDLEGAAGLADTLADVFRSPRRLLRLAGLLIQLPRYEARNVDALIPVVGDTRWPLWATRASGRRHARERDARAIAHHYDVGNDFYSLWLDDNKAYSCAYFQTGSEDLRTAQEAKFELICRKLRLRPGERLLDIGCGWGGLIRYAVQHHGVNALGITLSEAQATFARERIAGDGLVDRCSVELRDYRDLPSDVAFDKVVSVGMFEHVGRAELGTYFAAAMRLTRPGGLFLNHGIISLDEARPRRGAIAPPRSLWGGGRFMDRYVFPGGELVPLATAVAASEAAGFETRDVESLREHYAETLRHWVRRLEQRSNEARALVGEQRFRVWRLYMAASARAFRTARIGVVQLLLAKPTAEGACCHPRTRADLYAR